MTEEKPMLSPAQVAAALNVHPETVRLWLRKKRIRGVKVGRQWRIRQGDLERMKGME